jgi:MoaA/NifB/PqqE/SkfB family radical SAM enzyme
LLALFKYALGRRRYRLFRLGGRARGALGALGDLNRMEIPKAVRFRNAYYTSVVVPHWPSRAFDDMVARGGLSFGAAGTPGRRHIDLVILSLTRRCHYACAHCYERSRLGSAETVTLATWQGVVRELQDLGVGVLVFSGGEPLARYGDLLTLVDGCDKDRSDVHINTSGHGLTRERARELAQAGLKMAGIGLDDPDPALNDALRGRPGAHTTALQAARWFREEGVLPYFNVCLTRDLVRTGRLFDLLALGRGAGVGIVRLLEPRPVGGYSGCDMAALFGEREREATVAFLKAANRERRFADHPLVAYPAHDEAPERLGCMLGGLGHLAVDALGNVTPCVFVPVSFGNVCREPFRVAYERMRHAIPRTLRSGCAAVRLARLARERGFGPTDWPIEHERLGPDWLEPLPSVA